MRKAILSCVSFACNKMQNQSWCCLSEEACFISKGFSNWKKALARFKEHQVSECHKIAIDYERKLSRTCGNVWKMSSDVVKKTIESNRTRFFIIINFNVNFPDGNFTSAAEGW